MSMKIVLAPDSFKGTIRAPEVCAIWKNAFDKSFPEANLVLLPMSDGGEGALDAVLASTKGRRVPVQVHDALGRSVAASFAMLPDGAVFIESAMACGIELLKPSERNPMLASSYGVGELIAAALDAGARNLTVSIGGSATVDGGMGMLQALGARFADADGRNVSPGGNGLAQLESVDFSCLDKRIGEAVFRIASDVNNPLLGQNGAARVFGPQKGATPEMVEELEAGLSRYARLMCLAGVADDCIHPGDGAAGGMGFALRCALGAKAQSGAALIAELADLRSCLKGADLLITGEGKSDSQTLCGKLPAYLAQVAHEYSIPVLLCSGAVEDMAELQSHFDMVFSTVPSVEPLEIVLKNARQNLYRIAISITRMLASTSVKG